MSRVNVLFYASLATASAAYSVGFVQQIFPFGLVLPFMVGIVWAIGHWRSWAWTNHIGITLFVIVTAAGVWLQVGGIWLFGGVVFSLISWDMGCFIYRTKKADRVLYEELLTTNYLWRIGIVSVVCLILGGIALSINLEIRFGWMLVLGFVLLYGLSKAIGYLRRPMH